MVEATATGEDLVSESLSFFNEIYSLVPETYRLIPKDQVNSE